MAKLFGAKNREVKPVCEAQEDNSLENFGNFDGSSSAAVNDALERHMFFQVLQ